MVIGCVNDEPAPVLEIVGVAGVDVTTDSSVVGNAPGVVGELVGAAGVAFADATTDVSSVGNCVPGIALGTGELVGASAFCGSGAALAMFAFSSAAC